MLPFGAVTDPTAQQGVSSLAVDLILKGARGFNSTQISERLALYGAEVDIVVGQLYSVLQINVLSEFLEPCLKFVELVKNDKFFGAIPRLIQQAHAVLGIIIIEIIEIMTEHLCKGRLAGLSRTGKQDDFSFKIFLNVFFEVSLHGGHFILHSEKVKTFSEWLPKWPGESFEFLRI